MGLDMYMYKEVYVKNSKHMPAEAHTQIDVKRGGKDIEGLNTNDISYITLNAGYWRKANAIHNWFVHNVQDGEDDCGRYPVDDNQLLELKSIVEQVLANPELAPKLLPTTEGFFFGSTDYDEYYFDDVKLTLEIINKALAKPDGSLYYESSW